MYLENTSKSLGVLKRLKLLKHLSFISMVGLGLVVCQAAVMAENAPQNQQGFFSRLLGCIVSGCTIDALVDAAKGGDVKRLKDILNQGLDLNSKDSYGQTALHTAARHGQAEVIEELLNHGADLEAENDSGNTALHLAARNGEIEAIETLLNYGADLKAPGNQGRTPLHWAAKHGRVRAIKELLKHGADLDAADHEGNTALHRAVLEGERGAIKVLLKNGAGFAIENKDGKMPVELALEQPELQELFTKHINKPLCIGFTRLGIAAIQGDIQQINLLISYGAEITAEDAEGFTAIERALQAGQMQAARFLAGLHFNENLLLASEQGDEKAAEYFLSLNADINARDAQGYTPLMLAVKHDHINLAWELIKRGADLKAVNKQGESVRTFCGWQRILLSPPGGLYLMQQRSHIQEELADSKGASSDVLAQEGPILL